MDLKYLQLGAREYEVRSYFGEHTWKSFLKRFPEIDEISFIGKHGTWERSIVDGAEHDRVEIYLIPDDVIRAKTSDESWSMILMDMYEYLLQARINDVPLEVKVETKYLDSYSGWVMRDGLTNPVHFWHHNGIQGFSSRVRITEESERLLYKKSS